MRDELVLACLISAVNRENPKPGLMIHIDRGYQYTEHRFFDIIKHYKFILSHSRKVNPLDNAVIESYV